MDDLQWLLFPVYTLYVKYYFVPIRFSLHVCSMIVIGLLPEAFLHHFPPRKQVLLKKVSKITQDVGPTLPVRRNRSDSPRRFYPLLEYRLRRLLPPIGLTLVLDAQTSSYRNSIYPAYGISVYRGHGKTVYHDPGNSAYRFHSLMFGSA